MTRECGCEARWCAECGRGLHGSCDGPGATLHADCAYCRQRERGGTVTRKETT